MRNGALVAKACQQISKPSYRLVRNAIDDQEVANYHFTVSASSGEFELTVADSSEPGRKLQNIDNFFYIR
jgi:hypothetical protein